MNIFNKAMTKVDNVWSISIGGVRGLIYKEAEGRYSVEYLDKYVMDGFNTLDAAVDYLEKKFKATQKELNNS